MRTFLVVICSLALACAAGSAQEENKSKKPAPTKEEPQGTILNPQLKSAQHAAVPSGNTRDADTGATCSNLGQYFKLAGAGVDKPTETVKATTVGKPKTETERDQRQFNRQLVKTLSPVRHATVQSNYKAKGKTKRSQQIATQGGQTTGGRAGSPAVQLNKFSNTTVKPTTVGRPTTVGALATSPAPKRAVWSHNAGRGVITRPHINYNIPSPSGASQGQGKPADAKKAGEKVSPTPISR
jgi:hypothetical protein